MRSPVKESGLVGWGTPVVEELSGLAISLVFPLIFDPVQAPEASRGFTWLSALLGCICLPYFLHHLAKCLIVKQTASSPKGEEKREGALGLGLS